MPASQASLGSDVAQNSISNSKTSSEVRDHVESSVARPGEDNGDYDRERTNTLASNLSPSSGQIPASDVHTVQAANIRTNTPPSHSHAPRRFHAGLWDKDPDTTDKRVMYLKIMGGGTFLITLVIFGVFSIFWAALYDVQSYVHNLEGWVIDFDGGPVGQTVVQAFQNNTGRPQQVTWHVVNSSQFPNYPDGIEKAVVGEETWAIVAINPEASANLSAAISSADSSYDGSRAITAYAAEARNEKAYGSFLQPTISRILTNTARAFAVQDSLQLAANTSINFQALATQAPNVITSPVYYTIVNLRPFDVTLAQAVIFVGLIFLLIISFIVCMMNYQARVVLTDLNQHLTLSSLIRLRITVPLVANFFLSLLFSLLSVAFQAPFDRYFGDSGFVIYWMMNWMGMCALGFALEAMITILTPSFVPFFLMLWIITNVSVCSLPIEVLPGVFKYGHAAPFYNIARTARTILFNTRNQIGLNFGVQIAWIGLSFMTMTLFTILMRRREERAWVLEQETRSNTNKEKV